MMDSKVKWTTPICSAVIIVSFFMSFISLRSQNTELITKTGFEMIKVSSHSAVSIPFRDSFPSSSFRLPGVNVFALAALVLAIAQLILFLLLKHAQQMFFGLTGFAGGFAILLLRIQLDSSIERWIEEINSPVSLQVDYLPGYWLALVFFLIGGAMNLFTFIESQQQVLREQNRT